MSLTDNLAIVDVWKASAELTIPEVCGEDMHSLAPLRIRARLSPRQGVLQLLILRIFEELRRLRPARTATTAG